KTPIGRSLTGILFFWTRQPAAFAEKPGFAIRKFWEVVLRVPDAPEFSHGQDPKMTLMASGAAARRCARLANKGERFANHRLDGLDDEPRCGVLSLIARGSTTFRDRRRWTSAYDRELVKACVGSQGIPLLKPQLAGSTRSMAGVFYIGLGDRFD